MAEIKLYRAWVAHVLLAAVTAGCCAAQDTAPLPKIFGDSFDSGIGRWETMDKGWKTAAVDGDRQVLSQYSKVSDYRPPFRSPLHIALVNDLTVSDFEIDVHVCSTHKDYNHRDACLFFGFQSPSRFYYVHLGKKTDPHANQIFIVNDADRTKISLTTSPGTPWDEDWHQVRLTRNVVSGEIAVYFDDMEKPAMTARDKTFIWGRVGLGSFDDTSDWDDFVVRGNKVKPRRNDPHSGGIRGNDTKKDESIKAGGI